MKKKHFEYKGQMINYYNKVKNNLKVKMCFVTILELMRVIQ